MTSEGLSAILNSIKVSETGLVAFDLLEPWAIQIDYDRPITVTVIRGGLWLMPPNDAPQLYETGDSFVLPRGVSGQRYVVSSSKSMSHTVTAQHLGQMGRFEPLLPDRPDISLRRLVWGQDGGAQTRLMSFTFDWQDRRLGPLIEAIPDIISLKQGLSYGFLKDIFLGLDLDAADAGRPGFHALIAQMAQLFLVQAIRSYALSDNMGKGGLLAALADPHLSKALNAIHNAPGKHWSLDSLAVCAGLSRSLFASRFKEITAVTPMGYLRSWRIHLARRALRDGDATVSSIAFELGYQSEAAFRAIFRQKTGLSPRDYAKSIGLTSFNPAEFWTDQAL